MPYKPTNIPEPKTYSYDRYSSCIPGYPVIPKDKTGIDLDFHVELPKLKLFGRIYIEQLEAMSDQSFNAIMLLSLINQLCSTPEVIANGGGINLIDRQIAKLSNGIFAEQAVGRYIRQMRKAGMLTTDTPNKRSWLYPVHNKGKYILTVSYPNMMVTDMLVLSYLLAQAVYNAKAGLGFYVDKLQMKSFQFDFDRLFCISHHCINACLKKLENEKLFLYEEQPDTRTRLKPIVFVRPVALAYHQIMAQNFTSCHPDIKIN